MPQTKPSKDRFTRAIAERAYTSLQQHEKECTEAYRQLESTVNNLKASVSATAIAVQQTSETMSKMDKSVDEIKKALMGDEFADQAGLLKRVREIEEALHGDGVHNGIFLRKDSMFKYALFIAVLSTMVGGGVGGGLAKAFPALIKLFIGG